MDRPTYYCDLPGCWEHVKLDPDTHYPAYFSFSPDGIIDYCFCSDEHLKDWLENYYEERFGVLPPEIESEEHNVRNNGY